MKLTQPWGNYREKQTDDCRLAEGSRVPGGGESRDLSQKPL